MKASSKASRTQKRIVEAAIDLLYTQTGGQFSLDAVAKHAGVSKGGLLYNFPSKHALIRAMIQFHIDEMGEEITKAEAEIAEDPYRHKLMRALLSGMCQNVSKEKKSASVMLAAIADDPTLLDPVRVFHREMFTRIRSESEDPELATLVYLAVEGIHSNTVFEVIDDEQLDVEEQMKRMSEILK